MKIMIHIENNLHGQNILRFNKDHYPVFDFLWNKNVPKNTYIKDTIYFKFPQDAERGNYEIKVGIFNPKVSGRKSRVKILNEDKSIEASVGTIPY